MGETTCELITCRQLFSRQAVIIEVLRKEIERIRAKARDRKRLVERRELIQKALAGRGVSELREILNEREALVYECLRTRPPIERELVNRKEEAEKLALELFDRYKKLQEEHASLVELCASKRAYLVPPEYCGLLNVDEMLRWSPAEYEMARVLVAATRPDLGETIVYAALVKRLNNVMTHVNVSQIYRSLKKILRNPVPIGGVISGFALR